jgi:hypothetical protein
MKGKSLKLQFPCEGPYRVVKRINDVVYRTQQNPTLMMLVHLDRPTPYHKTLRMSGLKEGAMGAIKELTPGGKKAGCCRNWE